MAIKRLVLTERIAGTRIAGGNPPCGTPRVYEQYNDAQAVVVTVEIANDYDEDDLQIAIRNIASEMVDVFGGHPEY